MAKSRGPVWKVAGLAAGLALGAPAAGAAERVVIPFEMNRSEHMIVELEINGRTVTTGVVDTAATFAMVDAEAALRSGIAAPDGANRKIHILGVNGVQVYPVVRLDTIVAGNLRLEAVDAAYNTASGVPGSAANVMPASAFPGDVLEFDFDAGTITAYDGKPDTVRTHFADSVAYTVEGGLIFIEVRINGKPGRALIDTGSSLSYVNSAFARAASMSRNEALTHLLLGATGDSETAWIGSARKVRLADFYVKGPNLLVSDPVLLDELRLSGQPVMVLGLDYLSNFRLQFDRRRQRLILGLPGDRGGVTLDLSADATRLPSEH